MDIIFAAVIMVIAAHYGKPACDRWQAQRAMGRRLRQVVADRPEWNEHENGDYDGLGCFRGMMAALLFYAVVAGVILAVLYL
jgi:hypothetical protein